MVRRPPPQPPRGADWPLEKTLAALKKQLADLDRFHGAHWQIVRDDEAGWKNLTTNVLIHGFGETSSNVRQFSSARNAGTWRMGGMSDRQLQSNFTRRIESMEAALKASIAELELMLPEPEIAGAYDVGEDYAFYRDVKTIVAFATMEVFIIDSYLDTQIFDVYVENVDPSVAIRVLTNKVGGQLQIVAEKFAKRGNFELRSSKDVHDRAVFADDRCWVIGQSIKDAAVKKPTYIVEHSGAGTMRSIYESLWASAASVVKS
jgi:hypothetical protein